MSLTEMRKTISVVLDLTSSILVFSAALASSHSCEFVFVKMLQIWNKITPYTNKNVLMQTGLEWNPLSTTATCGPVITDLYKEVGALQM